MEVSTIQVKGGWHARDEDVRLTYFGRTPEEAEHRLREGVETFRRARALARQIDQESMREEA